MHCLRNNEQKISSSLEKFKYKIKKIHTSRFINTELETDSEPDSETGSESNKTTEH